jgi:hypothetical protein
MTSTSPPAYPSEYYYPQFLESRPDDPRLSPPAPPPLSKSVTTTTSLKKLTVRKKKPKNLAIDVVTDHGLPEADITELAKTDPKNSLIRDPAEKNIPKLIVNENIIKKSINSPKIVIKNLNDVENLESKNIPNGHTNKDLSNKTKPIGSIKKQQHQIVKVVEDKQPIDEYWKKEVLIDDDGVVAIEVRFNK